jgi:hypothetical protein
MKKLLLSAAIAALSAFSMTASATTITFNALEQAGNGYQFMPSYSESGFTFTSPGSNFGSAQQGNAGWYLGSASLFDNLARGIMLSKNDGGTFSFTSIDLAPVSTSWGSGATVSFIGNIHGGGTISSSYTLNSSFAFQTFSLSGFNNLDSVTWTQASPYHQFDNVVLDGSPVPEPATYVMLLTGLGLIGFTARRRKQATAI